PLSNNPCKPQPVQCVLFRNKSYVIYSALGSFYIPMFVMIFFYWRIYLVAIRTTRALKRGYRTTKSSGDGVHEERLTLRIHRGYATDDNLGEKCTIMESDCQGRRTGKTGTEPVPKSPKTRIPINIFKATKRDDPQLTVDTLSIAPAAKCNTLSPGNMV